MSSENYLQIPALGRTAELGYLYDARTESFREFIFKDTIPDQFINKSQTPFTFTEMNYTNNLYDKFNLFNIKAELSMSILCGLFTIRGSAAYLTEEKKSARQTEGAMVFKTTTISENLRTHFDGLRPLYNTALLSQSGATHMVTGVKWGANVTIKFTEKFSESRSKEETSGSLSLAFDKLKFLFSVSGSAGVEVEGAENSENTGFSMKLYGDISFPTEFPQNFKQVQEVIKKVPDSIRSSNDGKGVQIEYTLTPLSDLREHLKFDIAQNNFFQKLDESSSLDALKIFDEISSMEQRLFDIQQDLSDFSICIHKTSHQDLVALKTKFQSAKIQFQSQVREALVKMRSGMGKATDLSQIFDDYHQNEYSVGNVETKLEAFNEALAKIELYKTIRNSRSDIDYIGRKGSGSLELKLLDKGIRGKVVYVLYMKTEFRKKDPVSWGSHSYTFFSMLNQPFNKLIVVDCDFALDPEGKNIERTVIKQIYNGIVTIEDVNAELIKREMPRKPMEVKAIGRIAKLGDLYNARNDSFLETSFLKVGYPSSIVNPTNINDSDVRLIPGGSFADKCDALGVGTNQMFSIMADLYPLRRSGQFIFDMGTSTNGDLRMRSILYTLLLDEHGINILDSQFPKSINIDNVMKANGVAEGGASSEGGGATHFVSKIQIGFNSIFTLELHEDRNLKQNKDVRLEKQAEIFKQILTRNSLMLNSNLYPAPGLEERPKESQSEQAGQVTILTEEDFKELDPSISVRVFSDIQGQSQTHAETIRGRKYLLDYFNKKFFPQLAQQKDGHPLTYMLTPVDSLRKSHGIFRPPTVASPFLIITSSTVDIDPSELVHLYENITGAKNAIQNLYSKLEEYPRCKTDQDISDLRQIKSGFDSDFGDFTREMKGLTLQFRSNRNNRSDFVEFTSFLEKYQGLGKFGKDGLYLELKKMSLVESKLELCQRVKFHPNMEYIGRESSMTFDQLFTGSGTSNRPEGSAPIFILYYKPVWMKEKASLWLSASQRFFETLRVSSPSSDNGNYNRRYIVDCDFNHFHSRNVTEPTIYEFKDGKLVLEGISGERDETAARFTELYESLVQRIGNVEEILCKNSGKKPI